MGNIDEIKRKKMKELKNKIQRQRNAPIDATDENFNEIIKKNPLVLVDFWAVWCAPCHMVAPVVEALAKEYAGRLVCAKLNVDENQRTPIQFQILSIPTLLLFNKGKLVDRIVGAVSKSYIEERIKPYVSR